ncbi:3-hydroxyacyl-CoA dehydrogenase NAD-binding domain-containing protein [Aestuariivita boseongensis]|uniref:3-hydroxyacyl-CoA dehydrogenase NAD-binding domain-containing protein n=1 Tax=Aestuariivita boseongensis TaxID=1470562 RepID=UPI000682CA18|nr:3-hydroxyacyl-CoA dehydrogenase NAD-binding domain-containing protein [Aestuariivita boseongensis]
MTARSSVGVVGGGLIGMSWASLFLAKGCDVVIVDPDPATSGRFDAFLNDAWSNLSMLGLARQDKPSTPIITQDYAALRDVDFVQENGPEHLEIKRAVIAEIEKVVRPDVVIASSTSSLRASDMQVGATHPDRILVAHPMNPPHLVPMVELVAGKHTSDKALEEAEGYYALMERVTIRVKKEVPGHLANRLTSALYREAVHLVAEGIADVEDIDKAVAYGPGMRWAFMGPHLIYHLGGGAGGYRGYLDHLGPTQEHRWKSLGTPKLDDDTKAALVAGVERELEKQDEATLVERRDAALVELLRLKASYDL